MTPFTRGMRNALSPLLALWVVIVWAAQGHIVIAVAAAASLGSLWWAGLVLDGVDPNRLPGHYRNLPWRVILAVCIALIAAIEFGVIVLALMIYVIRCV